MFVQALAIAPHLSLGEFFGMVYEHLSGCFIPKDPSSRFLEFFQVVVVVVVREDILKSITLVLGANKLLAMVKDIGGLHPIVVGKVFFQLISHSIVLQLWGFFTNTYSPISLEFWPLEVVRPSLLAFKPSLTYTLIGPWCRSMLKTLLITFFKLLFLEGCVIPGGLWQALSPFLGCFMALILLFTTSMGNMWKGSPLLNHFQAQGGVTL